MADSFYGGKPGFSFIIVKNFASVEEMKENFRKGPDYSTVHYDEHVLINTENKNDPDNGKIYRRGYEYFNEDGGAIYVGSIVGPAGLAPMLELTTVDEVEKKTPSEGFDYRSGKGEYGATENLVPGKNEDGTFNDKIEWAYCSIRDENKEDCTAYIGFKIPYLVQEMKAESADPYYDGALIERVDKKDHPFYEEWNIRVPKGIKGDTFKNLQVVTATDDIQEYSGKADDVANQRKVLVYEYYCYDESATPQAVKTYLGDYNMIDNITISEDGTVTIDYSHTDDTTFDKIFKWIKNVSLDEKGHFTVEYNQETDAHGAETKYETDLKWVNKVTLAEDGTVSISYSTGESEPLEVKIKWLTDVSIADDGSITFTYNDSTTKVIEGKIKWLTDVAIQSDSGTGEGSGDQKVYVTYNDGVSKAIGEPLNYIMKTAMDPVNYHYLVYYSDPARRQELVSSGKGYTYDGKNDWCDLGSVKDESGILVGLNIDSTDNPEWDTVNGAIEKLKQDYPRGLQGTELRGKVVTIGRPDSGDKKFYAFDYTLLDNETYRGWFYLGVLSNTIDPSRLYIIGKDSDTNIESKKANLQVGGFWFVTTKKE